VALREVKVDSGRVALMGTLNVAGTTREAMCLMVLDSVTGKIRQRNDRIDLGDARFMQVEGETAYFVSRESDRTIAARAVRLDNLSLLWKTSLGSKDATLFPLVLAKDHVTVLTFESSVEGKFAYGASLLDRSGRLVQNIRSEPTFERPPHAAVTNSRVVFSVDNRVEVYR
jgi:hypothetical protein